MERRLAPCARTRRAPCRGPLAALAALTVASLSGSARAWVFPEHACATGEGIHELRPEDRATLDEAWESARGAGGRTLCPAFSRPAGEAVSCASIGVGGEDVDRQASWCMRFDALPAFAADHSCKTSDLVARTEWMRRVLVVSEELRKELEPDEGDTASRIAAWRDGHLDLAVEDREYLSRAAGNDSHFQPTRNADSLARYLERALEPGQPANATASFANFHAAALLQAVRWARTPPADRGKSARALAAVLLEAFALHFLEDSFSAGHIVGTWGKALDRKGTHDYFCQHGLEARTWSNSTYVAHGDAFLAAPDRHHLAGAVGVALAQLADALRGRGPARCDAGAPADRLCAAVVDPALDACKANAVPSGLAPLARSETLQAVFAHEPRPALQDPALPRFGQEAGVHVGPSAALDGFDGLSPSSVDGLGARGRLGLRVGVDLTDVLTQYDDTQALTLEVLGVAERVRGETLGGVGGRLRAPFYVVPGDLVIAGLLAAVCSRPACAFPLRRAAAGSVWWRAQRPRILGENTSFQFTLGRDVAFTVLQRAPGERTSRVELFGPMFTLRRAYPSGGTASSSFFFEVGPQVTWVDGAPQIFGAYASFGSATSFFVFRP